MKGKLILVGIIVVLLAVIAFLVFHKTGNDHKNLEQAEKDQKHRNITIVNNTDRAIAHWYIMLEDETVIHDGENPDGEIVQEISSTYEKYDSFIIKLEDHYGKIYVKQIENVPKTGNERVIITKDDNVAQPGDWLQDVFGFFNGE